MDAGVEVRVAGREPQRLTDRWPRVDAVELDVMRPETIGPATDGVSTAYYLIHSMEEGGAPFEERDRTAATNFARAAAESGVERVVFLGGSATTTIPTSPHLASRHETGRLLAEHGPAVLELRAGMVIGAGSASFRMLEDLVRRLPVMVAQVGGHALAADGDRRRGRLSGRRPRGDPRGASPRGDRRRRRAVVPGDDGASVRSADASP